VNSYLQRLQDAIQSATREMSNEALNRRPVEGKWSRAEVLEHLSLTYSGTVKNLQRSLKAGKALGGVPNRRQWLINMLVLDFGYFPSGRNSPESAKPKGTSAEIILGEIAGRIADMDDVIGKCEREFGNRACVADHPVLGPFTIQQWRKFHWIHGRHHLKQMARMPK
jgi:hypothetical protein